MPRSGGVYSLPSGSLIANGDTSDATDLNTPLSDLESDANAARPVVAGGTGASTAAGARTALGLDPIYLRLVGSTQNIVDNTFTDVTTWTTEDDDDLGDSTYTAGVLTIGTNDAGYWRVTAGAALNISATSVDRFVLVIQVSGGTVAAQEIVNPDPSGSPWQPQVVASWEGELAAGATVKIRVLQRNSTSSTRPLQVPTFLSANRIGG